MSDMRTMAEKGRRPTARVLITSLDMKRDDDLPLPSARGITYCAACGEHACGSTGSLPQQIERLPDPTEHGFTNINIELQEQNHGF